MKKLLFMVLVASLFAACTSNPYSKPKSYAVDGTMQMWDSGWVYFQVREEGKYITTDSVFSADGAFSFKGKITYPKQVFLKFEGLNRMVSFFLEAQKITVNASADNPSDAIIGGSPTQDLYSSYLGENQVYTDRLAEVYKLYNEAQKADDKTKMSELMLDYETVEKEELAHLIAFIKANPKSVIAPFLTLRNLYRLELNDVESLTGGFDLMLEDSQYTKDVKSRMEVLRNVQVGKEAPDFTMNDINGSPVTMSSLRGRYLLIDFWAAWCGPCRRENPNVVEAYKKYCEKGFDILGVSLDSDRDRWLKAIQDDHLVWHHVSDLKYWGNEAAKLYGVNSIPANVLLDPNGIIIARNLREKALHEKLEEIFGAQAVK